MTVIATGSTTTNTSGSHLVGSSSARESGTGPFLDLLTAGAETKSTEAAVDPPYPPSAIAVAADPQIAFGILAALLQGLGGILESDLETFDDPAPKSLPPGVLHSSASNNLIGELAAGQGVAAFAGVIAAYEADDSVFPVPPALPTPPSIEGVTESGIDAAPIPLQPIPAALLPDSGRTLPPAAASPVPLQVPDFSSEVAAAVSAAMLPGGSERRDGLTVEEATEGLDVIARRGLEIGAQGTSRDVVAALALTGRSGDAPIPGASPGAVASLSQGTTADGTLQMHQRGWEKTLGHQLVMMVENQVHKAEVRVNPPHLGPLEVHLLVDRDQATVSFFSHDASVRDAIESALPKLRELMSGQGVQLGDTSVSSQSVSRQLSDNNGGANRHDGFRPQAGSGGESESSDRERGESAALGLVDQYV